MKLYLSQLLREGYIILKTTFLFGVLIVILLFSFYRLLSTYSFVQWMARSNVEVYEKSNLNSSSTDFPNIVIIKPPVTMDERNTQMALFALHPNFGPNLFLKNASLLIPLLFALLGCLLISIEYEYKTSRIRAFHTGWMKVVFNKVIWIYIISFGLVIILTIFSFVGNGIAWTKFLTELRELDEGLVATKQFLPNFPEKLPELNISIFRQIFVSTIGAFFFGLIGLFLGLIFRNSFTGGIFILAISFFQGSISKNIPNFLKEFSFNSIYYNILSKEFPDIGLNFFSIPPSSQPSLISNLILIIYMIVLLVSIYFISKKQEIL